MGNYDLEKVRNTVRANLKGATDPTEFRPAKADAGKTLHYYGFVLPPISEGQLICGGKLKAPRSMDAFFLRSGYHYIENRRVGCPRQISGEQCELCDLGWEMVNELDQSDESYQIKSQKIKKDMVANGSYIVNIWFPPMKANPPECQDVVKWYPAPKTIVDIWYACLSRDDCGDPEVPQPFGVFFDEDNALLFDITVVKDGQNNGYKQSKFVSAPPRPLSKDPKKIKAILAARHDIWSKLPPMDPDLLARTVARFSNQQSAPNFNVDESAQESRPAAKPAATQKPAQTAAKPTATQKPAQAVKPAQAATKPAQAKPSQAAAKTAKPAQKPAPEPDPEPVVEDPPFDPQESETQVETQVEDQVEVLEEEAVAEEAAQTEAEGDSAPEDWEKDVQDILADLNSEAP